MTREPLSPAVVKMWSKVRRIFALIWELNLVIQKKSEFLGVEVALGLYAPLNASSCSRNNGPMENGSTLYLEGAACLRSGGELI